MTEDSHLPDTLRSISVTDPTRSLSTLDDDRVGIQPVVESSPVLGVAEPGDRLGVSTLALTAGTGTRLPILGGPDASSGSLTVREFVSLVFRHPVWGPETAGDEQSPGAGRRRTDSQRTQPAADPLTLAREGSSSGGPAQESGGPAQRPGGPAQQSSDLATETGDKTADQRRGASSQRDTSTAEHVAGRGQSADDAVQTSDTSRADRAQPGADRTAPPQQPTRGTTTPQAEGSPRPTTGSGLSIAGHRSLPVLRSGSGEPSSSSRARAAFRYRRESGDASVREEGEKRGPTTSQQRVPAGEQSGETGGHRSAPSAASSAGGPEAPRPLSVERIDPGPTAISTPIRPGASDPAEHRRDRSRPQLTPARSTAVTRTDEGSDVRRNSEISTASDRTQASGEAPTSGSPGGQHTRTTPPSRLAQGATGGRASPLDRRTVPDPVAFTHLSRTGPRGSDAPATRPVETASEQSAQPSGSDAVETPQTAADSSSLATQAAASGAEPAGPPGSSRERPAQSGVGPPTVLTPFKPGQTAATGGPRVVQRQRGRRETVREHPSSVSLTPLRRQHSGVPRDDSPQDRAQPQSPTVGGGPANMPDATRAVSETAQPESGAGPGRGHRPDPGQSAGIPGRTAQTDQTTSPRATRPVPKMTVATHLQSATAQEAGEPGRTGGGDASVRGRTATETDRPPRPVSNRSEAPDETVVPSLVPVVKPLTKPWTDTRKQVQSGAGDGPAGAATRSSSPRLQPFRTPTISSAADDSSRQQSAGNSPLGGIRSGGENLIHTRSTARTVRSNEGMPELTVQATEGTARTESEDARDAGGSATRPAAQSDSAGESRQESREPGRSRTAEFSERVTRSATTPGGQDQSRDQRRHGGETPPAGRETSTMYPDLTVKTLAPRIDATRREQSQRDITHRSGGESEQSGDARRGEVPGEHVPGERPYPADIDRMAERLYREIERKRRIERERRGL